MDYWRILITSLPTGNATVRQRAWRALKASGAAVLRDGVYLMPDRDACRTTLDGLAASVRDGGGTALVLRVEEPDGANFTDLFDRSDDYAVLLAEVPQARKAFTVSPVQDAVKLARKWSVSGFIDRQAQFLYASPDAGGLMPRLADLVRRRLNARKPDRASPF